MTFKEFSFENIILPRESYIIFASQVHDFSDYPRPVSTLIELCAKSMQNKKK